MIGFILIYCTVSMKISLRDWNSHRDKQLIWQKSRLSISSHTGVQDKNHTYDQKIYFNEERIDLNILLAVHYRYCSLKSSSSIVLIVLGIARTVLLHFMNYGYQINEYGMYWNFFITLGLLRVCLNYLTRNSTTNTCIFLLVYGIFVWYFYYNSILYYNFH